MARWSKISLTLSQGINSLSSKEVKSSNLRTWNAVPVQLARNLPPHVIQALFAPIATQMASMSVYSTTGIDVEDNVVVNSVVEVLYEVVTLKTRRLQAIRAHDTITCTPPMYNMPRVAGAPHSVATHAGRGRANFSSCCCACTIAKDTRSATRYAVLRVVLSDVSCLRDGRECALADCVHARGCEAVRQQPALVSWQP